MQLWSVHRHIGKIGLMCYKDLLKGGRGKKNECHSLGVCTDLNKTALIGIVWPCSPVLQVPGSDIKFVLLSLRLNASVWRILFNFCILKIYLT